MADDPYRIADRVDANMLEMMASRLEERGRDARFAGMIDDYLMAIRISDAKEVLDVGCGTGVVARRIAGRKDFMGQITGVDLSPLLIEKARELAASEGVSQNIKFETGDIRSCAFTDMATLQDHPNPKAANLTDF